MYLTLLLYIIVLYRPPGPLGSFLDELDTLLSYLREDGTPVILLGSFNLPPESHQFSSVTFLLQFFTLTLSPSPATYKAGNQLDLVFTRSCSTPQLTVTPLHVSDHCFVSFSLSFPLYNSNNSPTVTFRRNLCTLSHSSHLFYPLYTPPLPLSLNWLLMLLALPLMHASTSLLTHFALLSPNQHDQEIQILSLPDYLSHPADNFHL